MIRRTVGQYSFYSILGACIFWIFSSNILGSGFDAISSATPPPPTSAPFKVMITELVQLDSGIDGNASAGDYFAVVKINGDEFPRKSCDDSQGWLGGNVAPQTIFENFTTVFGDCDQTPWIFTKEIDNLSDPVEISISIRDDDPGFDDQTDAKPGDGQKINLTVDPLTMRWSGDFDWPQNCSRHPPYTLGEKRVRVCWQVGFDTDRDGLLDPWELYGFYMDGKDPDDEPDVDLPGFGANSWHKDLFVELDYMDPSIPIQREIRMIKDAFAKAPKSAGGYDNPDGEPGINLWIDTGPVVDPAAGEDGNAAPSCFDGIDNGNDGQTDGDDTDCLAGDNLGGGNNTGLANLSDMGERFYEIKQANFDQNRIYAFRYGLLARQPENDESVSDKGELGGNDFLVFGSLGITIMHELGHTLNLDHGGFEDHNCKPNYVSIMNYDYPAFILGTDGSGYLDYSPPRLPGDGGRTTVLADLDENALLETLPQNQASLDEPSVYFWYRPGPDGGEKKRWPLNRPVDWNGNGSPSDEGGGDPDLPSVVANIDLATDKNDCSVSSERGQQYNVPLGAAPIRGHDDWSNIVLSFVEFGNSVDGPINLVGTTEPTEAERIAEAKADNATDLSISKTANATEIEVGADLVYTMTVTNQGPPPAFGVTVTDVLPAGVKYAGDATACVEDPIGTLTCALGKLGSDEKTTFNVTVEATPDLCQDGVPTAIDNTATVDNVVEYAGEDINPADNTSSVQVFAVDTTPPDIQFATVEPVELWAPSHQMTPVSVSLEATDICDPTPVCEINMISSNEPVQGPGYGRHAPDWEITGAKTAELRAERSGLGDGRVYTLTGQCTDKSGNSAEAEMEVVVPHDLGSPPVE